MNFRKILLLNEKKKCSRRSSVLKTIQQGLYTYMSIDQDALWERRAIQGISLLVRPLPLVYLNFAHLRYTGAYKRVIYNLL